MFSYPPMRFAIDIWSPGAYQLAMFGDAGPISLPVRGDFVMMRESQGAPMSSKRWRIAFDLDSTFVHLFIDDELMLSTTGTLLNFQAQAVVEGDLHGLCVRFPYESSQFWIDNMELWVTYRD